MELQSERLTLGPWEEEEWREFAPISSDPEVMRYINGGVPWTAEETREFVAHQREVFAAERYCRWRMRDRATGELIGFCGMGYMTLPEIAGYEIGWWLKQTYWGQGLATEAAKIALRDWLERVRREPVISIAQPGNAASFRVMEKVGLVRVGHTVRRGFDVILYRLPESRGSL